MLKQNLSPQTCREWFIELCAWGPDFAARNECPAMLSSNYRLFFSISKHMANTTELHPKVRQTCIYLDIKLIILYFYKHLHTSVKGDKCPIGSSEDEDVVENIYNIYNTTYNVHRSWQWRCD